MIQTLQQIIATLTAMVMALSGQVGNLSKSISPASQLAQVSPTATLTLSPSSGSVSVGNTFTVSVILNTGGQNAYGTDINRLHFNPNILQVVDADSGTAGVQIAAGSLMPLTIINSVDNTGGTIQFSELANPGSTYNGSGTLATITFRAAAAGTSNVTFDFTLGSGTDTNVAGLGGDLLSSVGSGSYTGTVVDTTPPTISAISSSAITQTGATITWTTNENSDTQVEYGLTASYGNSTTLNSSLVTSHSAALSGLSAGTSYHYRVKSRDAAGNLATSADNTFATTDTTAPTTPGTPSLSVVSSSQINLSWTASTDNVGVTGYRVERCSGSATCSSYSQIATPSSNSYSDTGLTASTIYRYRVRAVDAAGNLSAYSTAANATTQAPTDVTPPTISSVTISGVTASGATITWTTNESANTQVDYGLTASYGNSTALNSSLVTSHSATLSGLSAGTSYHYRVKSADAAGNLAVSADNTFTTQTLPDTTAPSVPTGLSASATSQSQIQLSWSASTDPTGAGQIVSGVSGYQVFRGGTLLNTTASTAFLDSGLTPGTNYSYQVTAVDNAGNTSAKSGSVNATTPLLSLSVQRKVIVNLEGAPANKKNISGTIQFINPSNSSVAFQASITTDTSGAYTIDVPSGLPGSVTLKPVMLGYLSRLLTGVDLINTSVLNVNLPTLPAGDFNGDGLINSLDFSYMNTNWGTADALADINRDGTVNSLDFAYLSNNWLLTGE
jgi:fibronectin type 3 domain-containing protein